MTDPRFPFDSITLCDSQVVSINSLSPEHINPHHICTTLAKLCRYGGRGTHFYSVAEHSVLVMELVRHCGENNDVVAAALMHDAAEAYIGDIHPSIKRLFPGIKELEKKIEATIIKRFGLSQVPDVWEKVKQADTQLRHREATVLFPQLPAWVVPTTFQDVRCLAPEAAALLMWTRMQELGIR